MLFLLFCYSINQINQIKWSSHLWNNVCASSWSLFLRKCWIARVRQSHADILQELLWSLQFLVVLICLLATSWWWTGRNGSREHLSDPTCLWKAKGSRGSQGGQRQAKHQAVWRAHANSDFQGIHLGLYWDVRRVERKLLWGVIAKSKIGSEWNVVGHSCQYVRHFQQLAAEHHTFRANTHSDLSPMTRAEN